MGLFKEGAIAMIQKLVFDFQKVIPNAHLITKQSLRHYYGHKPSSNLKWPRLLKRFIDDGFGIFYGSKEDIIYWINQFNMLRESITIDKWSIGNKIEYMDLKIF